MQLPNEEIVGFDGHHNGNFLSKETEVYESLAKMIKEISDRPSRGVNTTSEGMDHELRGSTMLKFIKPTTYPFRKTCWSYLTLCQVSRMAVSAIQQPLSVHSSLTGDYRKRKIE
jgi:hypothetical protein